MQVPMEVTLEEKTYDIDHLSLLPNKIINLACNWIWKSICFMAFDSYWVITLYL